VILRLSEKARSLSQPRERGGRKRKLKTTVQQSDQRNGEGEKLNLIPRGITKLAFEFLSITSPRYFCPYLRNYLRKSVSENVLSDYWGFYYTSERNILRKNCPFSENIHGRSSARGSFVGFQSYRYVSTATVRRIARFLVK